MSGLSQELGAEKQCSTELQKAFEQCQQARGTLQEDYYGKESEVSALRQDLKVLHWKNTYSVQAQFHRTLVILRELVPVTGALVKA